MRTFKFCKVVCLAVSVVAGVGACSSQQSDSGSSVSDEWSIANKERKIELLQEQVREKTGLNLRIENLFDNGVDSLKEPLLEAIGEFEKHSLSGVSLKFETETSYNSKDEKEDVEITVDSDCQVKWVDAKNPRLVNECKIESTMYNRNPYFVYDKSSISSVLKRSKVIMEANHEVSELAKAKLNYPQPDIKISDSQEQGPLFTSNIHLSPENPPLPKNAPLATFFEKSRELLNNQDVVNILNAHRGFKSIRFATKSTDHGIAIMAGGELQIVPRFVAPEYLIESLSK